MTIATGGLRPGRARAAGYSLLITTATFTALVVPLALNLRFLSPENQAPGDAAALLLALLVCILLAMALLFGVRWRWGVPTSIWRVAAEVTLAGLLIVWLRQHAVTLLGIPAPAFGGRTIAFTGFVFALVPVPLVTAMTEAWLAQRLRREQQLRHDASRALEREERVVRERLFDELHGTLQVGLVLTAAQAGRIAEDPDADHARDQAARLRDELERLRVEDVRGLAHSLQPPLIEAGLVPSLRALVGRSKEGGAAVRLDDIDERTVTAATALERGARLALYRVAEEGLSNALQHAPGAAVVVSLAASRHELVLTVRDDGTGRAQLTGDGLGLRVLEARVAAYDGRLALRRSGRGTALVAVVPTAAPAT